MREFLVSFPRWDTYGITPSRGFFNTITQISPDWFQSTSDVSQLSLQSIGSEIIRETSEPTYHGDVLGRTEVKRQYNYLFQLLQHSGTAAERADTSAFLDDYTNWVDEMNINRKIPILGDDPLEERLWVTGAAFLAEWEGQPASVYTMSIHNIRTKIYETEEY